MSLYEIEQKYRIAAPGPMLKRLRAAGAKPVSGRRKEYNEIYDEKGRLKARESLLRLRHHGGKKGKLTFKGPRVKSAYKKRLEIETEVDADSMRKILMLAGFRHAASYDKERQIFMLKKTEIALDYMDGAGWFVEIEGTPAAIKNVEKTLGLSSGDREERNYLELSRAVSRRKSAGKKRR